MSKKWILILLIVVILLPVMLLIIGVTILNNTDLKEHRDTIAEHISHTIGRQLSLNGKLELHISSISSIVVTDITLANAKWASEPEMLTIRRVEARIKLIPLLTGNIHIPHFHLEGAKVLTETNTSGISNWILTETLDDEVEADERGTSSTLVLPWIGDMYIGDVAFKYHDGQTGKSITSKLDHARISATDKNSPTVIDIVGTVNKSPLAINGWLTIDTSASIPDIQSELNVTDLNLDKLLSTTSKTVKAKEIPVKKSKDERVFSEEPLPFDMLSQANIKATLRGNNLLRHNRRLKEVEARIHLVDGKLTASLLKHSCIRDKFVADIVVDASDMEAPTSTVTVKVPHLELGELLITGGGATAVKGPLAIDVALQGRGSSFAQIMGSLDGNINLLMEQGSANAKALDMFVGGLTAMVGTIFVDNSSKTKINCAICDFKLKQGTLTSQLAVLDTQYSTVFADGQVDLKNEQLDIKVRPKAKGVTLSVAYPVHLYGRLSNPSVAIKKTDALLKSGEIWANIVYPPSALLKFSDFADGKQNACVSMVSEKAGAKMPAERDSTGTDVDKGDFDMDY